MLFNIIVVFYVLLSAWGLIRSISNRNILGILFSGAAVAVFAFSIVNMILIAMNGDPTHPVW